MIKKILVTLILPITLSINAVPLHQLFNTPWQFVEDTFITIPENKSNGFIALCVRSIVPASIGAFTAYKTYDATSQNLNNHPWIRKSVTTAAGLIPAALSYHGISHLIKRNAEFKSLKKFILNWNTNKSNTPKQLQGVCDELYRLFQSDMEQYNQEAPEALRLIKKAIFEQFPQKYSHKLKALDRDFFDTKNLLTLVTFDAGNILRGIAELIRAGSGR